MSEYQRMSSDAILSVRRTLLNESKAVSGLMKQFDEDEFSQVNLANTLKIFYETHLRGGKIVCCGIGKSYKIATKTVATLKSLTIDADVLHPSEALHGDLGLLRDRDCLVFFTASGNTPELLQLLPHLSPFLPIVLLTCNKTSKLSEHPQVRALLFAELPPHLKEDIIHGLPAPTVSTTLSLVLADAALLALSEMIEKDEAKRRKLFSMKHPGGSIGSDLSYLNENFAKLGNFNSVSPSTTTHTESYSSLLSLNQVQKSFGAGSSVEGRSEATSLDSSDSEELLEYKSKIDKELSQAIKNAPSDLVLSVEQDEIVSWTEMDLLKNVTINEFITFLAQDQSATFGLTSKSIRAFYKSASGNGWAGMEQLLPIFKMIDL